MTVRVCVCVTVRVCVCVCVVLGLGTRVSPASILTSSNSCNGQEQGASGALMDMRPSEIREGRESSSLFPTLASS